MGLDQLLDKAGIRRWDRGYWFGGVTMHGRGLFVLDAAAAATIRRAFLPALQAACPGLELYVGPAPDRSPGGILAGRGFVDGRPRSAVPMRLPGL